MSQGSLYLSAANEIVALADENVQEPITKKREHHKPRPPSSMEHIYSKKTRGHSEIGVDEVGLFSPHHCEVFSRFMYRFSCCLQHVASFLHPSLSFARSVLYTCALLRPTFLLSRDARRAEELCNAVQRGLPSLVIFCFHRVAVGSAASSLSWMLSLVFGAARNPVRPSRALSRKWRRVPRAKPLLPGALSSPPCQFISRRRRRWEVPPQTRA